uniref:Ig-like domain-containing protein n=1 Tax=Gopherus agassizii TaxID=38772 RepID=A0A452GMW0_9SAUR
MASALTILLLGEYRRHYPKPSISLSPSGGVSLRGAVSVWCRGQHQGMRFMLNKEGRHVRTVDSDGSEVVFYISNMSREDGGNYSCSYHSRSEPFAVSYPSDPMELVVTGEGRGPAHPTGVTAPGADVTIRCQGQRWDLRFFLHKAGDLNPQQHMDTAGAGAEFRIPSVSRQQEGNYSCSYRPRSEPFVCSQPSEIVQLPGSALGPGPSRGDAWPGSRDRVTGGFPAREEQQPLEIWGRGRAAEQGGRGLSQATHQLGGDGQKPSYSKPNISGIPSGGVSLGAVVTICCEGQHRGVRFVLNKEQRHYPPVDSDGFGAEFLISNVSREDSGNYSCSYHSKSEPFAVSYPSDPVELVVRGEGPGSASLFPAPSWGAVGRSGPGSALSPDPAEGTPSWEAGTESLGGSPAEGSSSSWSCGADEAEDSCHLDRVGWEVEFVIEPAVETGRDAQRLGVLWGQGAGVVPCSGGLRP